MDFTRDFESQTICSYKGCDNPHSKSWQSSKANPKPRAKMLYIPITPIIQAYYTNAETSYEMCHGDSILKQTLDAPAEHARVKKSEFANSGNHVHHHQRMGLFFWWKRHCIVKLFRWCSVHHEKVIQHSHWSAVAYLIDRPNQHQDSNVIHTQLRSADVRDSCRIDTSADVGRGWRWAELLLSPYMQ